MLTLLGEVDDAALGVGGVATIGGLVGHLLAGETLGHGSALGSSSRPDGLPGLRLSGSSVHDCDCLVDGKVESWLVV